MPMRRRSTTGSMLSPEINSPSNLTSPCAREFVIKSFIRLKHRSSVLFPQPGGPINAVIFVGGIWIVMSLSAGFEPYQTERPTVESTTGSSAGAGATGTGTAGAAAGGFGLTRSLRVSETLINGLVLR